jgi:glycosyltransferase involved in cell wall biosynthesis/2-polyprenyl-3-methyl-5-hydroxy-6-metoxy-1,4-benzoquinol methylase
VKVLISAYACAPGTGSEPGAGWEFVRLAAERHDVWVLTCATYRARVEAALDEYGLRNVHFEFLGDPSAARRATRVPHGTSLYYLAWQRAARRRALELHREVGFDLTHHATFATDWMPAGVVGLSGVPAIWGPVGGATRMPWSAWRWLGWSGLVDEVARDAVTTGMRAAFGRRMARRANVTLAQNHDVEAALRRWSNHLEVLPHVIVAPGRPSPSPSPSSVSPSSVSPSSVSPSSEAPSSEAAPARSATAPPPMRRAVFVARLVPWKGLRIAVAALAEPAAANWRLEIYGDGPERDPAHRLAVRLGVADRIRFAGRVPQPAILAALSSADALLAPTLHDSTGFAIAEAVAHGCPIVTVDRAGPAVIVDDVVGIKVPVSSRLPQSLARALAEVGPRLPPSDRWSSDVVRDRFHRVYALAAAGGAHNSIERTVTRGTTMQATLRITGYADKRSLAVERARGRNVLHLGAVGSMCRSATVSPSDSLHAHLSQAAANCVGVDNNHAAVTELSEQGHFHNLIDADVAKLSRAGVDLPTIDVIVAGDIIEHLPDPGRALEVLSALSDPGTELVLTTPNALGAAIFLRNLRGRELEGAQHLCSFNVFTLRNLLARYGWVVTTTMTCYQPEARDLNPTAFRLARAVFDRVPKLGGTLFVVASRGRVHSP